MLRESISTSRKRYTFLIVVIFTVAGLTSLLVNLSATSDRYLELAHHFGKSYFQSVVMAREWNARHAGVYVPVTEEFQPNPYLIDPLRDLETTAGVALTKINPSYMTRLISGITEETQSTKIHMTSLKPLRPNNAPDKWERSSLEAFERGTASTSYVVDENFGKETTFRYMEPLFVKESCLTCHRAQGYAKGDIRGGISVTFPYTPFQRAISKEKLEEYLAHGIFILFGLLIIILMDRRLKGSLDKLWKSELHIQRLEGLLPICAWCKKIRGSDGDPSNPESWQPVDKYLNEQSDAEITHGICPDCAKKFSDEE